MPRWPVAPVEERLRNFAPEAAPDECWEFQGHKGKHGHGYISVGKGKLRGAHVVAWELANDREVPTGMVIRHHCDNAPCTNPAHLALGTHADNFRDRALRCPTHGRRLTNADVIEIRRRLATGERGRYIARDFPVSESCISGIKLGKAWMHLMPEEATE